MATAKYTVRRTSTGSSAGARVKEHGVHVHGQDSASQLPPMRAAPRAPRPLEVEKLDSWFEGVSQPSRRIQDLVRRKRERHDALVRQLRQELFRERSAAESTVAFISSNLRTELDKASLMVKLKGQGLGQDAAAAATARRDPREEAEALVRAEAAAGDVVQQLTEQRRRAVDAFYDLLLDVEAEHQKRAKAILRKFSKALAGNGHLPPHRLQPLLEAERKEVSELHLRHVISFGDLRLCLNMHAERDQRRFLEAVEIVRRQRCERRQREALAAIQEAGNKSMDEYIESTSAGRCCVEDFKSRLEELKVAVAWSESYPFSAASVRGWVNYVESLFPQIDSDAKKIGESLSDGLSQLKYFCIKEIESLRDFLICGGLATEENFKKLHRNVCEPLITSIDKKLSEDPATFAVASKELVQKLTKRFNSFACLLREAGELWGKFCTLQELSRQKTLQGLKDAEPQRTKCVEAKEQRIAKIIVKSKEVINKQHLHDNVSRIFRILDEVKCSLENMHKREINVIEEHTPLFDSDLGSFNPQLNFFLEKYGKVSVQDDFSVSTTNLSINFDLLEAVIQIIEQEKKRCFEEIHTFMQEQFKDKVQLEEKQWMQEMRRRLEKEFNDVLDSHQLRYNSIQFEVETARLVEIEENKKSLDFQKEEILKVSNSIQELLNEMFVKELQIFTNFSSQIKTLQKRGLDDKITTSIKSTIQEVEVCYKMCKETVKNLNSDFQSTIHTQIENMKKNNLQFIAGLRHFSDGGTFSEQEITNLKTEVSNLERHVEALAENHIISLKQRSKECCSEAARHVTMCRKGLQLHLENLDYTQNVTSLIQKTQCQLKKHTLALKYGGKLLTEQVADLDDEKIHDIKAKWRCVMQTVTRRLDCLLTKEWRKTAGIDTDISYNSVLMTNNEDCDYLSVIFHTLAESLKEIEHIVLGFNNKKRDHTVPKPGLHEEVKSFMTDIASTYRLYQEQCLDTWINELTVFLETISKLKNKHEEYTTNSFDVMSKKFSRLLEDEQSELTNNLKDLRREYQERQVDVMAQFKPTQGFSESQYVFSSLCSEFERLSSLLSENIKKLIESYTERAHRYLQNHESDLKEQISFIRETSDQLLNHGIIDDISQRIDKELQHLNELFTYSIAIDPIVFPQLSEKKRCGKSTRLCPPEVQISVQSLLSATENFWKLSCQNLDNPTYCSPNVLAEVFESSLQDAKILVHNRTCEIRHLYHQYKNMAEELRMKWRYTLENIQQR